MRTHTHLRAAPVDAYRRKEEMPIDHGHRTRRCRICDAWLCRYNEHPICWSHQPGGDGVLLEVAPRDWRRFTPADLLPDTKQSDQLRAEDFAELMEEAA